MEQFQLIIVRQRELHLYLEHAVVTLTQWLDRLDIHVLTQVKFLVIMEERVVILLDIQVVLTIVRPDLHVAQVEI